MPPILFPKPDQAEALRRLMSIKRHEAPPPGFFEGFSSKVIAQLEAETNVSALPWWREWLNVFVHRPALAGAVGMLAGVMLVAGGTLARTASAAEDLSEPMLATTALPAHLGLAGPAPATVPTRGPSFAATRADSSVSPVVESGSPFARRVAGTMALPVSYTPRQ